MLERFTGPDAERVILDSLYRNKNIGPNRELAQSVFSRGQLRSFSKGELLMKQGDSGQDVFFILAGEVDVYVEGQAQVRRRIAGSQVGEMAAMDPGKPRSATIIAASPSVVTLVVKGSDFRDIADQYPEFRDHIKDDVLSRLRKWIELQTQSDRPLFSFMSFLRSAVLLGVFGVFALGLAVVYFNKNFIVIAICLLLSSVICLFAARLNRVSVLWSCFITSGLATLNALTFNFNFRLNVFLSWLQFDGGYGGVPNNISVISMIVITAIFLYAAIHVQKNN